MKKLFYEIDAHSFDMKERKTNFRRLFFVSLAINLILGTAFALVWVQGPKIIFKLKSIVVEKHVEDIPLTDSAIVHELTRMGCVLPAVALAQMKIETGHFKSVICRENKNIAGIRTSTSKFVSGMNRDHCVYNTYRDCLRDYVRIQNRYLAKIDGKYAENPNYINDIKSIK